MADPQLQILVAKHGPLNGHNQAPVLITPALPDGGLESGISTGLHQTPNDRRSRVPGHVEHGRLERSFRRLAA